MGVLAGVAAGVGVGVGVMVGVGVGVGVGVLVGVAVGVGVGVLVGVAVARAVDAAVGRVVGSGSAAGVAVAVDTDVGGTLGTVVGTPDAGVRVDCSLDAGAEPGSGVGELVPPGLHPSARSTPINNSAAHARMRHVIHPLAQPVRVAVYLAGVRSRPLAGAARDVDGAAGERARQQQRNEADGDTHDGVRAAAVRAFRRSRGLGAVRAGSGGRGGGLAGRGRRRLFTVV